MVLIFEARVAPVSKWWWRDGAVWYCYLGPTWSGGSAAALNLFLQQLCIRHTKWLFLAHVIGSRETWFPVDILRTEIISTNFYEPRQAAFLY